MSSPIEVRAVRRWSDLRAFIDLPYRLHAGTPWVPPLRLERWLYLNRRLNAYFKHGRAQYFLARRDGRVVGRISAQVDHAYNAFHGNRTGMFGFLELEDDPEILAALLDAARAWLRAAGCDHVIGPMDLTLNDEDFAITGRSYYTGLPAGRYCDVIHGDFSNGSCSGPVVTVDAGGWFAATVNAHDAVAIHIGAKLS